MNDFEIAVIVILAVIAAVLLAFLLISAETSKESKKNPPKNDQLDFEAFSTYHQMLDAARWPGSRQPAPDDRQESDGDYDDCEV